MKRIFKSVIVAIMTVEARLLLARTKPSIVAVTGNVGKTSTKDAVYEVLKGTVHARKSEKSYNSEIGVPLSVLGLQNAWNNPIRWLKNIVDGAFMILHPGDYPKVLVLEIGVDRPGDMARLTAWIKPDVVVLTRLPDMPVHVEYFNSPEAVVAEKMKLVGALREDGVLVYNHDDERCVLAAEGVRQQSIGFARYSNAPFATKDDKVLYEDGMPIGVSFTLSSLSDSVETHILHTLGMQQVYNASAAAAVGSLFGVSLKDAADALASYMPPPGRMRILRGVKNTLVIDDSYNSSPTAAEMSLQTLKELKGIGRRIAVLGDMLELGRYSVREHERIGELAALSCDILLTVGVRARGFAKGALDRGMPETNILQYEDAERAGKELEEMLKDGDAILVKGSQGVRLERVVEEIMCEPERAGEFLVRQGRAWKQR